MIKAIIFDLDGTLVQTEPLRALSHARAAVELSPDSLTEAEVIEACKELVGVARLETLQALMEQFGLEEGARARMAGFGADSPLEAFLHLDERIYEVMLSDPQILRDTQFAHSVALLHEVKRMNFKIGLATMSTLAQTKQVLRALNLERMFDFIATADDVRRTKPDPEIFELVARALAVPADECLVIEDSYSGVQAALAAGMWCIAVPTPFSGQTDQIKQLLDERWVVDDPDKLVQVVQQMLAERSKD